MMLRYAHLSSQHLRDAANRINVTNSLQLLTTAGTFGKCQQIT